MMERSKHDSIREKYTKETDDHPAGIGFSQNYVEWLETQLVMSRSSYLSDLCIQLGLNTAHDYDGINSENDVKIYQAAVLRKIAQLQKPTHKNLFEMLTSTIQDTSSPGKKFRLVSVNMSTNMALIESENIEDMSDGMRHLHNLNVLF